MVSFDFRGVVSFLFFQLRISVDGQVAAHHPLNRLRITGDERVEQIAVSDLLRIVEPPGKVARSVPEAGFEIGKEAEQDLLE